MSDEQKFVAPDGWDLKGFDPNEHMLNLKGKQYLPAQYRLAWFLKDQRALIASGFAKFAFIVHTECVELDRESGFAHFKTYVRDVIGNEATMFGSETAKDFPDYAEKASTKSLGRALLALGYGTAFALEMDEGERVADSPVERRQGPPQRPQQPPTGQPQSQQRSAPPGVAPVATQAHNVTPIRPAPVAANDVPRASEQQIMSIRKLSTALNRAVDTNALSAEQARDLIGQMSAEFRTKLREADKEDAPVAPAQPTKAQQAADAAYAMKAHNETQAAPEFQRTLAKKLRARFGTGSKDDPEATDARDLRMWVGEQLGRDFTYKDLQDLGNTGTYRMSTLEWRDLTSSFEALLTEERGTGETLPVSAAGARGR